MYRKEKYFIKNKMIRALFAVLIALLVMNIYKRQFTLSPSHSISSSSLSRLQSSYSPSHSSSSSSSNLLPIMNPMYNMREFCKQCILLEDHLQQPRKRCMDCCRKHMLMLEALAEEAIALDTHNEYTNILNDIPERCRRLQKRFIDNDDYHDIAQEYRKIRKELMGKCFHQF